MRNRGSALILTCITLAAPPARGDDLCRSLGELAADQPNAFAKYQGARIMDNMIQPTLALPNASSCTSAPAGKTYQCSLPVAESDLVDGEAKTYSERVAACFPGSTVTPDQGMFGPRFLIQTQAVDFLVNGDIEEKAIGITIEPKQ